MRRTARQNHPTNQNPEASIGTDVQLLTVKEGAARCQISVRQLHRLIKAGKIPVKRFGRSIRIHPKDLGL